MLPSLRRVGMSVNEENSCANARCKKIMDGNNNSRISSSTPSTSQFAFSNTTSAYGTASAMHDVNLAQILYYQSKPNGFSLSLGCQSICLKLNVI